MGGPFSRSIEDQQLVFDEQGFGHDGTRAARTGDPGDCRNQMQKKDGEIAHRAILARSRHAQEMPTNCEFAMHRSVYQKPPAGGRPADQHDGLADTF